MTASEQGLVLCLLKESKIQLNINVKEVKVIDMEDGGMGSLYFVNDKPWQKRLFGKCISEKTFVDIDEMGISITLNVDKDGDLFELDIWRYDYKPLKKYPQC